MSQEKRRRFDKEFKMETARLTVEKGRKASDLALDLDIHGNVLRKWRRSIYTRYPERLSGKRASEARRRDQKMNAARHSGSRGCAEFVTYHGTAIMNGNEEKRAVSKKETT